MVFSSVVICRRAPVIGIFAVRDIFIMLQLASTLSKCSAPVAFGFDFDSDQVCWVLTNYSDKSSCGSEDDEESYEAEDRKSVTVTWRPDPRNFPIWSPKFVMI
jgi:hypothetical protein